MSFSITIILTTYNRANLVSETIESILNQTYRNWVCLIIDDNSEDNTEEVINSFVSIDDRIKFFKKGNLYNKGLSASRNMGLDLIKKMNIKPDFIQFFDDDDIMHPQKFEIQISELKKNKDLDLSIFKTKNFLDSGELVLKKICNYKSYLMNNIYKEFILGKTIFTAQVPLIKYDYIKKMRFNERLFYAEEWEFFNKLFFSKPPMISYINSVLYFHRKHEKSITTNFYQDKTIIKKSEFEAFQIVYEHVKNNDLFDGQIFSRFVTFAVRNEYNNSFLNTIKIDLKTGLLSNRMKDYLILFLLNFVKVNKKFFISLIHRVARL